MNSPSITDAAKVSSPSTPAVTRPQPASADNRAPRWFRRFAWLGALVALGAVAAAIAYEMRTSALQAFLLAPYAARLTFAMRDGPSPATAFPTVGPFNHRRGYSRLPAFQARLEGRGFRVRRQAVVSPELQQLVSWGIAPPYREIATAGLVIRGADGTILYQSARPDLAFKRYEDIPPLLVDSLLYIENRELPQPRDPRSNPVIEWDRQALAGLLYAGGKLGLPVSVHGGSTLGTQMEKYRHSPRGRTNGATDKVRQIAGASLKAYRDGADTRAWRNQIVTDYLNSIPLSAPPGWGAVHGIGEGLWAWFGLRLDSVSDAMAAPKSTMAKVKAYKHSLALLSSLPAPTTYLLRDRAGLNQRANDQARLLAAAGVIEQELAVAVAAEPLLFLPRAPLEPPVSPIQRKGLNAVRTNLLGILGAGDFYDLDGLHVEVDSTIDPALQREARELLGKLTDPDFARKNGLTRERLLEGADPTKVLYSLMLFERTPRGNELRVHADNLDQPFDFNDGVMLELGSTAKLRTLAHYLEIMTALREELTPVDDRRVLARAAKEAPDPLTRWAMETLGRSPDIDLPAFLRQALERRYSASPYETFLTGGGEHTFNNFDRSDNSRIVSLNDALRRSINLPFIRLMRDLTRHHQARLPQDAKAILSDAKNPTRLAMVAEIADEEARLIAARAHRRFRGQTVEQTLKELLGSRATSPRHLAILYFAWRPDLWGHESAASAPPPGETALGDWLRRWLPGITPAEVARLARAYENPRLNLLDHAYLLGRRPLDLWTAGALAERPDLSWSEVVERSAEARRVSSSWLLSPRNRGAQNLRLRIRFEREAFERMTPYWQRLGFPFQRLVPTYATAIGNSSDRPAALAELMGIILNDGIRQPSLRMTRLHFAAGTPYETLFEPRRDAGERVMHPAVATLLRASLADVVERGTAGRIAGAFRDDGKRVVVGGKTGSGDNRLKTFARGGAVTSSRAVNRTATFVFYIDDRYYGVLTAFVPGREAENYSFTSALPVTVLKLLAPAINQRL